MVSYCNWHFQPSSQRRRAYALNMSTSLQICLCSLGLPGFSAVLTVGKYLVKKFRHVRKLLGCISIQGIELKNLWQYANNKAHLKSICLRKAYLIPIPSLCLRTKQRYIFISSVAVYFPTVPLMQTTHTL